MNYFEIHNFYGNKEVHSNINYTFRKYTPIKTKKPAAFFHKKTTSLS